MKLSKEEIKALKVRIKAQDTDAMCELANWHDNSCHNYNKAKRLYKKSAKLGSTEAMFWLSQNYRAGNSDKCIALRIKAAELGNAEAAYSLAKRYDPHCPDYDEYWLKEDYHEAAKWYVKAAELGHVEAMYEVGLLYDSGVFRVPEYPKYGTKQALKIDYGLITTNDHNVQAARWYKAAASKGNKRAKIKYAKCCIYGRGTNESPDKAYELLLNATNSKKYDTYERFLAMVILGDIYNFGIGREKDRRTAYDWYCKANLTNPDTLSVLYRLNEMYDEGIVGYEQSYKPTTVNPYSVMARAGEIYNQKIGYKNTDEQYEEWWKNYNPLDK